MLFRSRLSISPELSGKTPARAILRRREQQAADISNEQLSSRRLNDRQALQMPLASRAFLQVDQATFENQVVFRNIRECRENTNLDCHLRLRAGRHYQKAFGSETVTLHNSTDFESHLIRETPAITSTYGGRRSRRGRHKS